RRGERDLLLFERILSSSADIPRLYCCSVSLVLLRAASRSVISELVRGAAGCALSTGFSYVDCGRFSN
ncbi:hypothetical protein A2U01_0092425, partial [Trifolium medium]|nr:hypothetical protein [Trifolium medium]